MVELPEGSGNRLSHGAIIEARLQQIRTHPVQELAPRRELVTRGYCGAERGRVTAIVVPALVGRVHGRAKKDFGIEDLVLKQTGECGLKPAAVGEHRAADDETAGAWYGDASPDHAGEKARIREYRVRWNTEAGHVVERLILRSASPTEPVPRPTEDTAGLGRATEDAKLLFELARQPEVVRIEESDVLAAGLSNGEVARLAMAPVPVPLVLEVPDALGLLLRVSPGLVDRFPLGPVVHQQ